MSRPKLSRLVWTDENIEHIARHQVTPEEVEEVCFSEQAPLVRRGRGSQRRGSRRLYYILGQTESGRYLFIVLRLLEKGDGWVVTARDMDSSERKMYEGG